MQITPQSGFEAPYTVTTDAYGNWQMVPLDSVSGQFGISSPLTVTAPTGGSAWSKGITRSISWNYGYADIGYWVKIELLKGGVLVSTLSESCVAGANGVGSFDWTPSAELTEGTDYQVRMTSGTYPNITNVSGNFILSGNFTAGGTVTIRYNGEASPITATNV
ncbi:MAG: Ser-Thr-rich GPI-anchored membrane family protein [Anaerotignum sp.]|nr:Ser-Thr-rich GPI-anchored membrane family protein [Anaerotignum sp.]